MLLKVDHSSRQALHDQLAGQLRAAISSGAVGPGDRLAPARELAAGLDVNVHTVLRALKTLKEEGLVDMRRGRGTVVTGTAPKMASLSGLAEQLVVEARRSGLGRREIIELVEAKCEHSSGRSGARDARLHRCSDRGSVRAVRRRVTRIGLHLTSIPLARRIPR